MFRIQKNVASGKYARQRLFELRAPSMAKTTAIDSKQCRRARPKGSPALLCALGSRFWGESPDGNVISRLSSGYLGRKPGRETFFCISSGFLGRFPGRVSLLHTPWKDYEQKVTEVYRKTSSKHRFGILLGNKTGKMRSRCFRLPYEHLKICGDNAFLTDDEIFQVTLSYCKEKLGVTSLTFRISLFLSSRNNKKASDRRPLAFLICIFRLIHIDIESLWSCHCLCMNITETVCYSELKG